MHIRSIEASRSGKEFRVYYVNNWGDNAHKEIYAKDELEAYTRFNEIYKEGAKRMRVVVVSGTIIIITLLSSLTYSCTDSRSRYERNMRECVKSGKNYISEGDSYSCRDPFIKTTK